MAPKHSLDAGQIGCVYHHLPGTCCKNDSITAAKRNRVAKLNAVAAGVYGHNEVESDGGGTSLFQKSREPFQSGTRPFTRTNPVLFNSRAASTPKARSNCRLPSRDQKSPLGFANLRCRELNFLPEAFIVVHPVPIDTNGRLVRRAWVSIIIFARMCAWPSEHDHRFCACVGRTVI